MSTPDALRRYRNRIWVEKWLERWASAEDREHYEAGSADFMQQAEEGEPCEKPPAELRYRYAYLRGRRMAEHALWRKDRDEAIGQRRSYARAEREAAAALRAIECRARGARIWGVGFPRDQATKAFKARADQRAARVGWEEAQRQELGRRLKDRAREGGQT